MANLFSKILSAGEGKEIKAFRNRVGEVNYLEDEISQLSDEELREKTIEFRERYADGESLEELLPEAFAVVREASVRTLGLRHFDVQLIGGMVLNEGQIAEMKTGEGKTLVSTLAGYLNAIPGEGVHIVTVNDYLAKRDSEWMGQVYEFLGMSVGLIQNGTKTAARKAAYDADVTYGTNAEFGFDYLRDNMVVNPDSRVQRGHAFAIVDEVDSILIDEARTPLIISGAGSQSTDTYRKFANAVKHLSKDVDFEMDEAKRTIATTDSGLQHVESLLGIEDIYSDISGQLSNHLQQALKAQFLFHRDVDYVVVNGEVKIVDEFTGRIMEGRRYSEGLHQAIEAKEGVLVRAENQTMATITLQNYFRLYDKLSGMTATKRESFCDAVASTMRANGYGLDEITVSIKKKPQATDNGTVVFMRVKGTGDCYSAHYADGTWTVFPLLERVDGVNDDLAQDQIDSRADTAADADATEQSAAAPKKTFAITDTEQAAKYIGDSCAGALMDAWRAFAAEKEGGADADSALFSRDHVTHNDDGTVTFTVWMPSSQKTYRGVADMAAGSVSFSE